MKKYIFIFLILFTTSFALSYKDFYPYLVDIKGWEGDKPTGSKISAVYGEMISAQRTYHKNDKKIEANIMKGGMAASMFAPFTMITEIDTPEEYVKVFKINGFKAGLSHNKIENSGQIVVFLTEDSVFSMNYEKMSYKEAVNILKKFPLKDIARKILGL